MSDKEDDIEILSTKLHDNSRPESRNLDDRCVNILLKIYSSSEHNGFIVFCFSRFDYEMDLCNENQFNADNFGKEMTDVGGHLMQKFTNNIIHFTD